MTANMPHTCCLNVGQMCGSGVWGADMYWCVPRVWGHMCCYISGMWGVISQYCLCIYGTWGVMFTSLPV